MGTSEMSNSRALGKDPETPGTATADKTRLRGDKSQLMHGGEVITPNTENKGRGSPERCPLLGTSRDGAAQGRMGKGGQSPA